MRSACVSLRVCLFVSFTHSLSLTTYICLSALLTLWLCSLSTHLVLEQMLVLEHRLHVGLSADCVLQHLLQTHLVSTLDNSVLLPNEIKRK